MDGQLFQQQQQRIRVLIQHGIEPYISQALPNNTTIEKLSKEFSKYSKLELTNLEIAKHNLELSGRVVLIRNQGGVIFANLANQLSTIQLFFKKNTLSAKDFFLTNALCIGDIIHISGTIMKTNTNILTIRCSAIKLLSIALIALPVKTNLSNNLEVKYRQRYLDLLTDKDSFKRMQQRSLIIKKIRNFLSEDEFIEVETPILQTIYGGAIAKPFKTFHNKLKQIFFLRVSEEISLKKLLIGGVNRVFEIGRIFRNEGISPNHNPEFTLLEWYEAYATLNNTQNKCISLFQHIAKKLFNSLIIQHGDNKIDLRSENWKTIRIVDAINDKIKVNFDHIFTLTEAKKVADEHHIMYQKNKYLTIGKIIELFFQKFVEHTLISPTFISDFPVDVSPLAKKTNYDSRYCERVELYINGWELANAFNELTDYFDQKERLERQKETFSEYSELKKIDESFLTALKYAMPPASGIGIGIDRLVMLFTNSQTIKDVILFPTLKRQKHD